MGWFKGQMWTKGYRKRKKRRRRREAAALLQNLSCTNYYYTWKSRNGNRRNRLTKKKLKQIKVNRASIQSMDSSHYRHNVRHRIMASSLVGALSSLLMTSTKPLETQEKYLFICTNLLRFHYRYDFKKKTHTHTHQQTSADDDDD